VAAAAVRVIQEGLTNAIKHSPGAPISVTLRTEATGLDVEIVNGPAVHEPLTLDSHEGGTGLAGLGQRVQDHGGHVVAGPAPAGGWCLAATFPAGAPPDSRAPARKQRSTGRLAAGMLGR
jgi:signal transduction histidine kinase